MSETRIPELERKKRAQEAIEKKKEEEDRINKMIESAEEHFEELARGGSAVRQYVNALMFYNRGLHMANEVVSRTVSMAYSDHQLPMDVDRSAPLNIPNQILQPNIVNGVRRRFRGEEYFIKAAELFRRSAENGKPEAGVRYAFCLNNGIGVDKDRKKAVEFYRMAAEKGNPEGCYQYAVRLEAGEEVEKDLERAASFFKRAADLDDMHAKYRYGRYLENGTGGVAKDLTRAAECYKIAAENGIISAYYHYARCLESGTGIEKDLTKAAEYYKKAIYNENNMDAMCRFGYFLENGMGGLNRNLTEAMSFYERAALAGNREAIQQYVSHLQNEEDVKRDPSIAVKKITAIVQCNGNILTDMPQLFDAFRSFMEDTPYLELKKSKFFGYDFTMLENYFGTLHKLGGSRRNKEEDKKVAIDDLRGFIKDVTSNRGQEEDERYNEQDDEQGVEQNYEEIPVEDLFERCNNIVISGVYGPEATAKALFILGQCLEAEVVNSLENTNKYLYYYIRALECGFDEQIVGHRYGEQPLACGGMGVSSGGDDDRLKLIRKCCEESAERGNSLSRFFLGWLSKCNVFGSSSSKEENLKIAAEHFKISAEQGNPLAQFSYGVCLEKGLGAEKNLAKAYKYYKKAANSGDKLAEQKVDQITKSGMMGMDQRLDDTLQSFAGEKESAVTIG